jgi:SAM-dependent MidA family methyltransferase
MRDALYGAHGFYREPGGPAAHFRTSVHVSASADGHGVFVDAVVRLLGEVDERLGRPRELTFLDVGAGRGELAAAVLRRVAEEAAGAAVPDGARRLRVLAVEAAAPADGVPPAGLPAGYPPEVRWLRRLPSEPVEGLLVANEWLDNVPLDLAEVDGAGVVRYVEVDPEDGVERLGGEPSAADARWLAEWWPLRRPGERAEIGRTRDAAWAAAVGCVARGTVLAIDYAHRREERPARGTLTAFRDGREVRAVPDGSRDLTAHVAVDACAAAGERAGARGTVTRTQREALRGLGVDGARPSVEVARADPVGYLRALGRAGEAAELTDPAGLGAFTWLRQEV